jgi:hypothetical protein
MRTNQDIQQKIKEHRKLIGFIKIQMTEDKTMVQLLNLQGQIQSHTDRINVLEWVLEIPISQWYDPDCV